MSELKHEQWAGTTYGNGWMHKWLIRFLRVVDMRLVYLFAFLLIVPPTMVLNGKARRVTYRFYRRRFGFGRIRSAWMTYKNHCAFSQVVIDKFAMYAGKKFRISIDGYDRFKALSEQPSGFVQLSSHIGNYEIAGYSLAAENKRLNALVFGGEKASVMANRSELFREHNIRMIPMKADMSHLFVIDSALADGEILSMPADRIFGSQKAFRINFLGKEAAFPQGPFMIAALRNLPILFVSVMKTGAREYHITVSRIESDGEGNARAKARLLAEEYVKMLEKTLRRHPAQWYNYFDFWAEQENNGN